MDEVALGSVEYGVEHLQTPLLVVWVMNSAAPSKQPLMAVKRRDLLELL
jgi:hypothetical protein